MSYNNSVSINDCITALQLVDDFTNEADILESIIRTATLTPDDKERLKKLLTKVIIKNTKQTEQINQVANKLNKIYY